MAEASQVLRTLRKAEYARLRGKDRRFIKGQKYTLLSRHENLTLDGKRSLQLLLAANKRLNTAYVLKEAFGQLWDYGREGGRGASSTTGEPASKGGIFVTANCFEASGGDGFTGGEYGG